MINVITIITNRMNNTMININHQTACALHSVPDSSGLCQNEHLEHLLSQTIRLMSEMLGLIQFSVWQIQK